MSFIRRIKNYDYRHYDAGLLAIKNNPGSDLETEVLVVLIALS
jgi:hypothetical protein